MHKKRATSDTQPQLWTCGLWSVDFDDLSLQGSEGRVHSALAEFFSLRTLSVCQIVSLRSFVSNCEVRRKCRHENGCMIPLSKALVE